MKQATTVNEIHTNAWPIDTPDRILDALTKHEGATAQEVSDTSGIPLPIVIDWLSKKVSQGLLRFDASNGLYFTFCSFPGIAIAVREPAYTSREGEEAVSTERT